MRRLFMLFVGTLLVIPGYFAYAQSQTDRSGFAPINPPLATQAPGKIEVIEFFSYACGHCDSFHPMLKQWVANLPEDVYFRRIPVGNSGAYGLMARTYYALKKTDAFEKLDDALFDAIHGHARPAFNNLPSLAQWVAGKGFATEQDFLAAFQSAAVTEKLQRGQQLFINAGADGVPTLVVDGKYRVLGEGTQTFGDLLARTDTIIAMRRAERAKP